MTEMQPSLAAALLALVPGAQADTTRVTVEYRYTQLDVQSVDSWNGSVDGLACRIANHLRTTPTAPEKDTAAPAVATATPGAAEVLAGLARALREQPTGRQVLDGLDELGELLVGDGEPGEVASWVAALCSLAHVQAPAPGPAMVYRAGHESIVAGLYTTAEEAQRHCEALVSREYPDDVTVTFDWLRAEDVGDYATCELVVWLAGGDGVATGYTVTPVEVAAAYDPDADE